MEKSLGELPVVRWAERSAERSEVTIAACSKGRKAGDLVESLGEMPVERLAERSEVTMAARSEG